MNTEFPIGPEMSIKIVNIDDKNIFANRLEVLKQNERY